MGAVETLTAERNEYAKQMRELAVKAEQEQGGIFTDDQVNTIDDLKGKFVAKDGEVQRAKTLVATQEQVAAVLDADDAENINAAALKGAQVGFGGRGKSVGRLFTESKNYKALRSNYPEGIPDTAKGIHTGQVQIGSLKALVTSSPDNADYANSAGVLVRPDYYGVAPYPVAPGPNLRQLITIGSTQSDKIEYAQFLPAAQPPGTAGGNTASTNNAQGVKEAVDVTGTTGTKPQSDLVWRKKSVDVITIAHWIAATKRALSDAAQLRTLIDAFLRDGIIRKVEQLIVDGDADAPADPQYEEWDGILNTAGIQAAEFDEADPFGSTRHMITQVEGAGGQLTAFAVSPAMAETLDLAKNTQGNYYGAGPYSLGPTTLWGRPRVTVYGIPDDTVIGGDWRTCVLWDRESTTLTATDAHADFFVRNLVAILAEARAAFAVLNPQLMCVAQPVVTP